MSPNQNKKTYTQPKLSTLGSAEKLTLSSLAHSRSHSYAEAKSFHPGHAEIS